MADGPQGLVVRFTLERGARPTLGDGGVMAFSGLNFSNDGTNSTVEIYDPSNHGAGWTMTAATFSPPLYDPATNKFSTDGAGTASFSRLYHSTALLLPDASVMSMGSNPGSRGYYAPAIEIYAPAYLFDANE